MAWLRNFTLEKERIRINWYGWRTLLCFWCTITVFAAANCYLYALFTEKHSVDFADSLLWASLRWPLWLFVSPLIIKCWLLYSHQKLNVTMLLQRLLVISLYLAVAASLLTSMVKYLSPLHPDDFAQLWYLSIINEVPLSISAMTGLALFINYTFSQEATESPSTSNASVANCFRVITASGSRKVEYQDVSFIKAAGNFMELHLRTGEELLHRSTMKKLTELLDEDEFYRVHRSYLVNIADILEVTSNENNEPCLLMRNKVCISVSRQYAKKLRERFNTKTLKQALLH